MNFCGPIGTVRSCFAALTSFALCSLLFVGNINLEATDSTRQEVVSSESDFLVMNARQMTRSLHHSVYNGLKEKERASFLCLGLFLRILKISPCHIVCSKFIVQYVCA